MKLHFPKLYRYERQLEPCQVAIPFAQGELFHGKHCAILDGGRALPLQTKVTGRYPDGSIRWLFVRFVCDLPGNAPKDLEVVWQEGDHSAVPMPEGSFPCIKVRREGRRLSVDGGEGGLVLAFLDDATSLFDTVHDGYAIYDGPQFQGPVLEEEDGTRWTFTLGEWTVEEDGPLCAVLCCPAECMACRADDGKDTQRPTLMFQVTVYAGKPYVEIACRLINTMDRPLPVRSYVFGLLGDTAGVFDPELTGDERAVLPDPEGESGLSEEDFLLSGPVYEVTGVGRLAEIEAKTEKASLRTVAAVSNYRTNFRVGLDKGVSRMVDAKDLMVEANEHFPEVFYGTLFADRTTPGGGVCATVFQAQQNFPKAVKADASGLYVMLVPSDSATKIVLRSGMSREQRFLLHFHGPDLNIAELDNRSLIYQMPDRPSLPAEAFRHAGVMPGIFVDPDRQSGDVEKTLMDMCDGHTRSMGMLNYGDAPDMHYTEQGRGGGSLVWLNNEYDFPHAAAMMYARTGERRFLDDLIAHARHWMDVDVCHYHRNPSMIGGQWQHTRGHVEDGKMLCSHQWVEGLLDMYHFTGDERALRTAIGIGENILYLLTLPQYQKEGESNARETGWALRTLTALYLETGETRWLERAEWIVDSFEAWQKAYGGWLAPYTDNTLIRVPFMICIAVGSLMRYHRVFPQERIRGMILSAVDDLLENCVLDHGGFYYKELPSLNHSGGNTLILEALTCAYELTGETRYLEAGREVFDRAIHTRYASFMGPKKAMEDAVVCLSQSPKMFAQSFIPLVTYYRAMTDEGMLE